MKARAKAKGKAKRMARPRGGGHVPQANGIISDASFDMYCGAGSAIANVAFDYGDALDVPFIQAWTAKNPGTFRMVLTQQTALWEDQSVEGSWGDGVTGQGFFRVVNAQGELLLQSQTFNLTGID